MVIEVTLNVMTEVITGTSKLRKLDLKLDCKLTTSSEHLKPWTDPVMTKYDGK